MISLHTIHFRSCESELCLGFLGMGVGGGLGGGVGGGVNHNQNFWSEKAHNACHKSSNEQNRI